MTTANCIRVVFTLQRSPFTFFSMPLYSTKPRQTESCNKMRSVLFADIITISMIIFIQNGISHGKSFAFQSTSFNFWARFEDCSSKFEIMIVVFSVQIQKTPLVYSYGENIEQRHLKVIQSYSQSGCLYSHLCNLTYDRWCLYTFVWTIRYFMLMQEAILICYSAECEKIGLRMSLLMSIL